MFDFTIALVRNEPLIFAACAQGLIRVYKYEESNLALEESDEQLEVSENDAVEELNS